MVADTLVVYNYPRVWGGLWLRGPSLSDCLAGVEPPPHVILVAFKPIRKIKVSCWKNQFDYKNFVYQNVSLLTVFNTFLSTAYNDEHELGYFQNECSGFSIMPVYLSVGVC